jgi:hypothetical protein|tara:strand:+ start:6079 stop:6678 length:600 start_codon:yes stop_codon:yes gene_type:complete
MSDKLLLREYFALQEQDQELLTESERALAKDGSVFLTGKLQEAGVKNGNGRIYRRDILEREMKNFQKQINERRSVGELDHPEDSVINLKNTSHIITEAWWDGDAVMGKVQLLNTPSGQILKNLVQDNVALGLSSRGLGTVSETNEATQVNDDFQLICFDVVSEPSTPGAYMSIMENKNRVKDVFSKADRINRLLNDIVE